MGGGRSGHGARTDRLGGGVGAVLDQATGNLWVGAADNIAAPDYPDKPDARVNPGSHLVVTQAVAVEGAVDRNGNSVERGRVLVIDGSGWYEVELGDEGGIAVLSTDLGRDLDGLDDAGFDLLVDRFLLEEELGVETVRRDVLVGVGRAKDSVVAAPEGERASRIRFLLAGGRLHVLATHGPDEYSRKLDEAHARLIAGYAPDH